MKYLLNLLLPTTIGLFIQVAHAEGGTCPDGYYPIGGGATNGCAPLPQSYYGNNSGNNYTSPPSPPVRWANRYGAIIYGTDSAGTGMLVTSKDKVSAEAAKNTAIQDCISRGGHSCVVNLVYYNQCAAVVAGARGVYSASSSTVEKSIEIATENCNKASHQCEVYYTGCSMAVRVQ